METGVGAMLPQAWEHRGLPHARRGKKRSFCRGLGGSMAMKQIDFKHLVARNVREYTSSHPVCGALLPLP